jgi:hypothetical protein
VSKSTELRFAITICVQAFRTCQVQQGLEVWFGGLPCLGRLGIKGFKGFNPGLPFYFPSKLKPC